MRKEAFYPILFSAFMFLGVTGCSGAQSVDTQAATQPTTIPYEPDQDLNGLVEKKPNYKVIYDKLRQQNLGFVLFTIENLTEDINVRFTRVNASFSEYDELNHQELPMSPGTDNIFAATSCTGRYKIEVSTIGGEYHNVSVLDLYTREPSDTFTLNPSSCARTIRLVPV